MALGALLAAGLSAAGVSVIGACNYGVFAAPSNAGATVCKCTCGDSTFDPDSGDSCLATCRAPFDSAEKLAHQTGCDAQFAGYSQCLEDRGVCSNRSFDAPQCGALFAAVTSCEAGGAGGAGG